MPQPRKSNGRPSYICDETISKTQLKVSVKKIVDSLNIETSFANGRPENKWFQSFMKRHPDLTIQTAQNLTSSRASVSKTQLKRWYDEVNEYLHEKG